MPKTICVIDDEKGIREEMRSWLGEQGYQVMTAASGDEAIEKMHAHRPHLVILDLIMPQQDGFEVLTRLKRDGKMSSIPVIMLTAKTETSTIMQAQSLQAADFFMKPFNSNELLKSIQRHI